MSETYFKLLDKRDAHFPVSGSLQFRNVNWFALLEACTGDNTVGDINEGVASSMIGHLVIGDPKNDDLVKTLNHEGNFYFGSGATGIISNSIIAHRVDAWAMCFAKGDPELALKRARNANGFPYDGCIILTKLEGLLEEIKQAKFAEGKISDHFKVTLIDMEYGNLKYDKFEKTKTTPTYKPAAKDKGYIYQNETRILLTPFTGQKYDETLRIQISNAEKYISELETNFENSAPSKDTDINELLSKLHELYNKYETATQSKFENRRIMFPQAFRECGEVYWKLRSLGSKMSNIELDLFYSAGGPPTWTSLAFRIVNYLRENGVQVSYLGRNNMG